jgi:hypothetical protein
MRNTGASIFINIMLVADLYILYKIDGIMMLICQSTKAKDTVVRRRTRVIMSVAEVMIGTENLLLKIIEAVSQRRCLFISSRIPKLTSQLLTTMDTLKDPPDFSPRELSIRWKYI